MNKDQYIFLQKYFHVHSVTKRLAHFFAVQLVFFYVALPFFLIWTERGRDFIVASGLALVVSWGVLVKLITYLWPVARPYQKYKFLPAGGSGLFTDIDQKHDSFPSGHATALTVLTLIICMFNLQSGLVSGLVVLLVAIWRILLGYHYTLDMLGGLLIAIVVWGLLQHFGIFSFIFAIIS